MESRVTRSLPVLAITALLACAVALHLHTVFGAESPESAVRETVESSSARYVGDCGTTVSPRDVGAVCSKLISVERGTHAYLVGRTFSEFTDWLFVEQTDRGHWQVVAATPLDLRTDDGSIPWP
jgi:hypothetical protein